MKELYVLTSTQFPHLCDDDKPLIEELSKVGVKVIPQIWDEEFNVKDKNFLIRTVWDYHKNINGFMDLLKNIDENANICLNDFKIVSWNFNKRYLGELQDKKLPIVPTEFLDKFSIEDFEKCLENYSEKVVVKPTISASGHDTFLLDPKEYSKEELSVLNNREVMVQPFIESIQTIGEYSFMLFNGVFSHSIIKTPKEGHFKVQKNYGGREEGYIPSETEIKDVQEIVSRCPFEFPYVRIDVVRGQDNQLLVMEVEAIEPELFFRFSDNGIEKFSEMIRSKII